MTMKLFDGACRDTGMHYCSSRSHWPISSKEKDIRGLSRDHYKQLAREKEKQHGIAPLYSIGFYKKELFTSIAWVDSFTGQEADVDLIIAQYEKFGLKIIEKEYVDDQLRFWFTL